MFPSMENSRVSTDGGHAYNMNLRISVSLISFESWSLQQVPLMSLGMFTLRRESCLNPGFI